MLARLRHPLLLLAVLHGLIVLAGWRLREPVAFEFAYRDWRMVGDPAESVGFLRRWTWRAEARWREDALHGVDFNTRELAICALVDIEGEETTAFVVALLSDPDPKVRSAALWALHGHIPDNDATRRVLLDLVRDPDRRIRQQALFCLQGRLPDDEAVRRKILALLLDTDSSVRREACQTLRGRYRKEDVPFLDHLIRAESDRWTRLAMWSEFARAFPNDRWELGRDLLRGETDPWIAGLFINDALRNDPFPSPDPDREKRSETLRAGLESTNASTRKKCEMYLASFERNQGAWFVNLGATRRFDVFMEWANRGLLSLDLALFILTFDTDIANAQRVIARFLEDSRKREARDLETRELLGDPTGPTRMKYQEERIEVLRGGLKNPNPEVGKACQRALDALEEK